MSKLSELLFQARERMGPEVAQQLNHELRNAAIDIRRNVLEKGWFGEPVTADPSYTPPTYEGVMAEVEQMEADAQIEEPEIVEPTIEEPEIEQEPEL